MAKRKSSLSKKLEDVFLGASESPEGEETEGAQEAKSVRKEVVDLLAKQDRKRFLKQARWRGLELGQWLDLLDVARAFFDLPGRVDQLDKKDEIRLRNWIKDVFQFSSAGNILVKGEGVLDLSARPLVTTVPKGLIVQTLFLSKKISKGAKRKIQELEQRGDIKCTVVYL